MPVPDLPRLNLAAPPERADAAGNRAAILAAARALMRDRSIRDIGMAEIAAAAGVGKGTLYRRFDTKVALAKALFTDALAQAEAELGRRTGERLDWFVRRMARLAMEESDLLSVMIMKSDRPLNWWLETDLAIWLSTVLKALAAHEAPGADTAAFARIMVPALVLVGSVQGDAARAAEEDRLSRQARALLSAE